jgi:DNA primase
MSELASRVGLSFGAATKRAPTVAEALWDECRRTLLERDEGAEGRGYLAGREMPFHGCALGFIDNRDAVFRRAGVPPAAAWKARLLTAPDHDPGRWDQRVVGPITANGEVVGLWGRAVRDGASPKYLLCGQGPGWLELGSRRADRVVVVEGPFDALRVEMATRDRVVALLGAAVTDDVLEGFDGCAEVVFALDADAAGEQARRKLAKQLIAAPGDWSASFVVPEDLGEAKDFDELFRQEGEGAIEGAIVSRMTWLAYAARRELEGREGPEEALALRRVGGLCRAAGPRWAAEVGLVVRDLVEQSRIDEGFVRRVLSDERGSHGRT